MKFDVVIGNPPYQINDEGKRADGSQNASASPIYPHFVESSMTISNVQSLIIPARWTTGAGKGLTNFSKMMLDINSIKYFNYYAESKDIFPNNLIRGGISYFVNDKDYVGPAKIDVNFSGKKESSFRLLDEHEVGVFIPFKELSSILTKVKKVNNLEKENMQDIVSILRPFGLRTDFFRNPKKYGMDRIRDNKVNENDIEIFGLEGRSRTSKFVPNSYSVPRGHELIDSYKVFLPYASGGDTINGKNPITVLGNPIIGKPNQISTETYLAIGNFNNKIEAINLYKYLKTKFLQALIMILKSTQHATRTFRLVPIQDFTKSSDIDWSQSITEIDQQLYGKYDLDFEEIKFIEDNIRRME